MKEGEPRTPAGDQGRPADPGDRLAAKFRISKKLQPFVNRMRLRLKDLDLTDAEAVRRLDGGRQDMRKILEKKKVARGDADKAIEQALEAAANYQIELLRWKQADEGTIRARKDLHCLMRHIEQLSEAITKLPPISKGVLNKLTTEKNWTEFDAEVFGEFFGELLAALSELSPARIANDAAVEIRESLRARNDPVVAHTERTAPPALIELWDCIPDATRLAVEAELRAWTPPARRTATAFFARLKTLLEKHRPKPGPGRRHALVSAYLNKIAAIWQRLNLKVGLARGGSKVKTAESSVQQFARFALAAVGDNSPISARQIGNLKKDRRLKMQ
jgi:hypothetical protein